MGGLGGGAIMVLAGIVMVIRGLAPQFAARTRGKRALFGLLSPGGQRVALVIIGLLLTLFGVLIVVQGLAG